LRRIRQLGFSEFVFPGATHTRFAHCVGVFHVARRLLRIVAERLGKTNDARARVALCASLLHDVGHGPFSHVFEGVLKGMGRQKRHEQWTAEIITGDTEVRRVLELVDPELPGAVARLIKAKEPVDLYASVVSSQFDADRLDYLRRDRYMTGVRIGDFDLEWLLDCLEVGEAIIDETSEQAEPPRSGEPLGKGGPTKVETFVLNRKAWEAAEGYLEARYQLYRTVYYHKTTRSAEVILRVLLARVGTSIEQGDLLGLHTDDPVVGFLSSKTPRWSSISHWMICLSGRFSSKFAGQPRIVSPANLLRA
jgi:uncharacterized protein